MNLQEEIEKCEQQLEILRFQQSEQLCEQYGHLIGKCLKLNHVCWNMVTRLVEVKKIDDGSEGLANLLIKYKCIRIIYNPKEKKSVDSASIDTDSTNEIRLSLIEQYAVPYQRFAKAMEKCMERISKYADSVKKKSK